MIKKIYFGSLLFFAAALLSAANLYFKGTTDKSPIEYKSGETMKFSVSLMEDGKPVGGKRLFWTLRSDEGITASGESVSSADKPFEYETSLSKPGFVHLRIVAVDENGNRLYYCNAPVEFETEGEIEIIGPKVVSLIGGSTGTYVKTTGNTGAGKLTIKSLGKVTKVDFNVK